MSAARVAALVAGLTLDEKALLTAGRDGWSTQPVERAGIPPVRVTDGPNGARGSSVLGIGDATAVCVPCGSALGATWDPELIERVGVLLGEEARTKGCRVLLAPTVNLHRHPLSGRNFECFSEDPLLSGHAAAAYVRGVQSAGVATTVKHLVANEAELERATMSSDVDERALRELYLLPFELAVRESAALGVMTSYNRLNGRYLTEDAELLAGTLRDEWGFEGFVVSDWFALADTVVSARAGLDLEMPGPARAYGAALAEAVRAGRLEERELDAMVTRLLGAFDALGALDDPPEAEERSVDRDDHHALAREAAAAAMVLLRNDGALPLAAGELRRVAVIGPNAARAQIMGGGSAKLRPHRLISPVEALRARLGDGVEVLVEAGCDIARTTPLLEIPFAVDFFAGEAWEGEPVARGERRDGEVLYTDGPPPEVPAGAWSFRARAVLVPEASGPHELSLTMTGPARLLAGERALIDGFAELPPRGEAYFGMGREPLTASVELTAGEPVELVLEYANAASRGTFAGARIGLRAPAPEDPIGRAVAAAARADAVIVVVGTNDDWESEGHDRRTLALPGEQDQLVRRVLAANPRTVVVLNTGAPVDLPWADDAPALVQAWFGGQGMSEALADVLLGDAEPGGRLPTTYPLRLEDTPAWTSFPGEGGRHRYGEGVFAGYRWFDARALPVRFPFGHGLSYTTFELGPPRLSAERFSPGGTLTVEVQVRNTGARPGSEVVQCYVAPPAGGELRRPPRELKAHAKVHLRPGEAETIRLHLGDRAFAAWHPGDRDWLALLPRLEASPLVDETRPRRTEPGWVIAPGTYTVQVGRSAADLPHAARVEVAEAG